MASKKFDIKELARGAVMEQFDIEFEKVIANIMNPNTPYKATRKITLEITLKPNDEDRDMVSIAANAKIKLAAYQPINAQIAIGRIGGEYVAEEIVKGQIKGQTNLDELNNDKVVNMKGAK